MSNNEIIVIIIYRQKKLLVFFTQFTDIYKIYKIVFYDALNPILYQ